MATKIRFWLGLVAALGVSVSVILAAVYLEGGWIRFGVIVSGLAVIGMVACWLSLDARFNAVLGILTAAVFILCCVIVIDVAIVRPMAAYDSIQRVGTFRFVIFDVKYDRNAVHLIDDLFWYAGLPVLTIFIGLFIAGFLSSGINLLGKRNAMRKHFFAGLWIGMGLSVAAELVLTLSTLDAAEWFPPVVQFAIRLSLPVVLLFLDALLQKAALESVAKGTVIDAKRQSIGVLAQLACFYGVSMPWLISFFSISFSWLVTATPIVIGSIALIAAGTFAKRRQIGRMVAIEAVVSWLIAIGTCFMVLLSSIGVQ